MSMIAMKKLTLLLCGEDVDGVLRKLMYLRCVDVATAENVSELGIALYHDPDEVAALNSQLIAAEDALKILNKHSHAKTPMFAKPIQVGLESFISSGRYAEARRTVAQVNELMAESTSEMASIAKLDEQIKALTPWLNYDMPLDFTGTEHTTVMLGSVRTSVQPERFGEIYEAGGALEIIKTDSTAKYICVMCHRDDEENVTRALARLGFTKANPVGVGVTAAEETARLTSEAEAAVKRSADAENRLREFAASLGEVQIFIDATRTELNAAETKLRLAKTENCAVMTAWVPVNKEEKVTALLGKYECAYELSDPVESDDPPVLLKNNSFAKNFEWVLGMYSYPKYGTYDPTFVMGIFYCLIFGMMFADVAYGLILVAAGFGAVKLLKPREGMKRFLLMFAYCGIGSAIMGVFFGGYFGDLPQEIMINMMGIENPPDFSLILNPMTNPMGFLILSVAMGGAHIVASMAIKMYVTWRDGHPVAAILDVVPWWILFAGLIMLYLKPEIGKWVAIGGVILLILTQGHAQKGIIKKLIKGVSSLYGLISYAQDLISYSRIMALGLASSVLAQVFNILGTMMGGSPIGFIFMILVLIVGHVINIAINVLGSFVHTSRLQYIEFFSRFFEEGGRGFKPVQPADKYTIDNTNI